MLRNASDVFLAQTSQRKFIDTVDEVLTSSRTSPVVRERLMEVLAAAAYITTSKLASDLLFQTLIRLTRVPTRVERQR